jgi:hypothetical protein
MKSMRISNLAPIGVLLLGFACTGEGIQVDERWNESDPQLGDAPNELGLSADEKAYVNEQLAEPGTTIPDSAFVGRTLKMGDAFLDLDPMLERRDEKGRIVLDVGYITERGGGVFAFARPQAGEEVWLVVPQSLQATFQRAVTDISNMSFTDCLDANFVNIKSPAELSARRATEVADFGQILDLNIMVTEVHDDVSRCAAGDPGCADLPTTHSVNTLQPVPQIGFPGESENVFGLGRNISIDPTDPELRYVVTHQLLHALGLGDIREEVRLRKAIIPGTQAVDSGFRSIMHDQELKDGEGNLVLDASGNPIPNPDVSLFIALDDADSIATLYAPPCDLGPRQTYILSAQMNCFGGVCQ